jgi:hypothetical protein
MNMIPLYFPSILQFSIPIKRKDKVQNFSTQEREMG